MCAVLLLRLAAANKPPTQDAITAGDHRCSFVIVSVGLSRRIR